LRIHIAVLQYIQVGPFYRAWARNSDAERPVTERGTQLPAPIVFTCGSWVTDR